MCCFFFFLLPELLSLCPLITCEMAFRQRQACCSQAASRPFRLASSHRAKYPGQHTHISYKSRIYISAHLHVNYTDLLWLQCRISIREQMNCCLPHFHLLFIFCPSFPSLMITPEKTAHQRKMDLKRSTWLKTAAVKWSVYQDYLEADLGYLLWNCKKLLKLFHINIKLLKTWYGKY